MKPRIVFDTNVFATSLPNRLLDRNVTLAAREALDYGQQNFIPVMCNTTQRELDHIYLRDRYDAVVPKNVRRQYVEALTARADIVQPDTARPPPVCADPDDVAFLSMARQREAQYLVTGDYKHLGSLGHVDNTLIVNPTQFLLLENQGQRLGLTQPTRVVQTDQPDLLRQGHAGSTVFLSGSQAGLVRGHTVEVVPTIPLYNPHHAGLKKGEPEGFLMVTDNPDLLGKRNFSAAEGLSKSKDVVVVSTGQYALLGNVISTDPVRFAAEAAAPSGASYKTYGSQLQTVKKRLQGQHGLSD